MMVDVLFLQQWPLCFSYSNRVLQGLFLCFVLFHFSCLCLQEPSYSCYV